MGCDCGPCGCAFCALFCQLVVYLTSRGDGITVCKAKNALGHVVPIVNHNDRQCVHGECIDYPYGIDTEEGEHKFASREKYFNVDIAGNIR